MSGTNSFIKIRTFFVDTVNVDDLSSNYELDNVVRWIGSLQPLTDKPVNPSEFKNIEP